MGALRLTFWGVRGSIPVPGQATAKYGGNTSCLELRSDRGDWIIFDAGTGLRTLGDSLDLSKKYSFHIMISHPHWDHIDGFPFFTPVYIPGNSATIYGPATHEFTIADIFGKQMRFTFFPVRTEELVAAIDYRDLSEERLVLGNFTVETIKLNHPVDCLGYKVRYEDKVFVYLGDNEPYYNVYDDGDPEVDATAEAMNRRLADFVAGADALVTDCQYLPAEYEKKRGWGHSTVHHALNMAAGGGVKRVFMFHHDPLRTDAELDYIVEHYRAKIAEKGINLHLFAAAERQSYEF